MIVIIIMIIILSFKKKKLPFGQVPYMEHETIAIAQSGAIARYIAKLGGLNGSNDSEFAKSEMLLGETDDLMTGMTKCMYTEGKDKNTCFDEYFAGPWKVQMGCLEKLIPDGEKYFIPGATRCAGGYGIACACEIALSLQPDCLDAFPKVKAFAEEMIASPAMEGLKDWSNYITRA